MAQRAEFFYSTEISIGRLPMLRNVMDCLKRQVMYKSGPAIDANLSVRHVVGVSVPRMIEF
jgi:hypothetical protein